MAIHNLPLRHKESGNPYTFLGMANPRPSADGAMRLVIYSNEHGALFWREIPDFVRAFEWHNGLPIEPRAL